MTPQSEDIKAAVERVDVREALRKLIDAATDHVGAGFLSTKVRDRLIDEAGIRALLEARAARAEAALAAEGHAYEESLEREDGWIARCEAAEAALSVALGERDRLVEALRPFAKVAQPINGEAGRPTPLELITKETEELAVTAIFETGGRGAVLWADDFRAASQLLSELDDQRGSRVLASSSSAVPGEPGLGRSHD
jgi:hypothetical protein